MIGFMHPDCPDQVMVVFLRARVKVVKQLRHVRAACRPVRLKVFGEHTNMLLHILKNSFSIGMRGEKPANGNLQVQERANYLRPVLVVEIFPLVAVRHSHPFFNATAPSLSTLVLAGRGVQSARKGDPT